MAHKERTPPTVSPLAVKASGFDVFHEVDSSILQDWLAECEIEGAKLSSENERLTKEIQYNSEKAAKNQSLTAALSTEVSRQE